MCERDTMKAKGSGLTKELGFLSHVHYLMLEAVSISI